MYSRLKSTQTLQRVYSKPCVKFCVYQARMPCSVPWQGGTTGPCGAWLCVCAPRFPKFMFIKALAAVLPGCSDGKLEYEYVLVYTELL